MLGGCPSIRDAEPNGRDRAQRSVSPGADTAQCSSQESARKPSVTCAKPPQRRRHPTTRRSEPLPEDTARGKGAVEGEGDNCEQHGLQHGERLHPASLVGYEALSAGDLSGDGGASLRTAEEGKPRDDCLECGQEAVGHCDANALDVQRLSLSTFTFPWAKPASLSGFVCLRGKSRASP